MTKWPRMYAAEIANMGDREQRRAALESVPEVYRGMVQKHVENTFMIRREKRRAAELRRSRERRGIHV